MPPAPVTNPLLGKVTVSTSSKRKTPDGPKSVSPSRNGNALPDTNYSTTNINQYAPTPTSRLLDAPILPKEAVTQPLTQPLIASPTTASKSDTTSNATQPRPPPSIASNGTPQQSPPLPLPLPSEGSKRRASGSPSRVKKKTKRSPSHPQAAPPPPPPSCTIGPHKCKPPPPPPPPLPLHPSYQDFLLCNQFKTPLVRPSPLFRSPSPELFAPVASTSRAILSPPPLFSPSSSTKSSPTKSPINRSSSFSPSNWEFLNPDVRHRTHLSDDEVLDSDHDEWAEGAEPSKHDIKSIPERFEERTLNPWTTQPAVKYWMNSNVMEPLPDAWDQGPMRATEERMRKEEEEKAERRRKKGKEKVSEKGKERGEGGDTVMQDEGEQGELKGKKEKKPFLERLKEFYDIDEPFTDDEDIEAELDAEGAVGLAALARPFIRGERDRRKRRREKGKETDGESSDDSD